jgi:imidazolonepropionase-like amidohydrolase
MKIKSIVLTVILVFFCLINFSYGQDLLIKNGSVLTVTQGQMPGADILIQNGIITKIGMGIEMPEGIRTIDAKGKFVIPGIIDTHTHIALSGTNEGSESITSEVNMRDVLDAEDTGIYTALSGGVTMIHTLHGSANAIAGENITLKMKWGKPAEDLIVHDAFRTLKFALGENPKRANSVNPNAPVRYPQTRMGVNAIIRREFMKAKNYMEQWDRYKTLRNSKKPPENLIPPRKDLRLEPLAEMLRGNILARCHAYRADEMIEFINLSKEFGFKIACFEHASEAFKIAKELAANNIGTSVFTDSWAYKDEAAEGIAYSAGFCTQQGVLVSINSDSGERIRRLFNDAAKTIKYGGLSEDQALKLVTLNPAIQLGVDKIVGSLEVGKHGDIAIFSEHPLSAYTRCDMTIIEGEIYFDRNQYLKEREEIEKQEREAAKKKGGSR